MLTLPEHVLAKQRLMQPTSFINELHPCSLFNHYTLQHIAVFHCVRMCVSRTMGTSFCAFVYRHVWAHKMCVGYVCALCAAAVKSIGRDSNVTLDVLVYRKDRRFYTLCCLEEACCCSWSHTFTLSFLTPLCPDWLQVLALFQGWEQLSFTAFQVTTWYILLTIKSGICK